MRKFTIIFLLILRALEIQSQDVNKELINDMIQGIKQENVTFYFEGIETQALRTSVKMKIPELIMGGSNVLIVYYVTSKVRDRYVSCILSHYTDDINADDLPPLLGEVMEIKK